MGSVGKSSGPNRYSIAALALSVILPVAVFLLLALCVSEADKRFKSVEGDCSNNAVDIIGLRRFVASRPQILVQPTAAPTPLPCVNKRDAMDRARLWTQYAAEAEDDPAYRLRWLKRAEEETQAAIERPCPGR